MNCNVGRGPVAGSEYDSGAVANGIRINVRTYVGRTIAVWNMRDDIDALNDGRVELEVFPMEAVYLHQSDIRYEDVAAFVVKDSGNIESGRLPRR